MSSECITSLKQLHIHNPHPHPTGGGGKAAPSYGRGFETTPAIGPEPHGPTPAQAHNPTSPQTIPQGGGPSQTILQGGGSRRAADHIWPLA